MNKILILLCTVYSLNAQIRPDFIISPKGSFPHIVADMEDKLHLTWYDNGIYYGLFDSLGNQIGEKVTIAEGGLKQNPRLAASDEHVAVVWTSYVPTIRSQVNGAVFNRTQGSIVGTSYDIGSSNGNHWPDVRCLTDSKFLVVWSGDAPRQLASPEEGIYGLALNSSLSPAGDTLYFTDDLPEHYSYFHPRIIKNEYRKNAVITWMAFDFTIPQGYIFARRLGSDASVAGSSFKISEGLTFTRAWGLSGVMDADGNFTMAWTAEVEDSLWNVYLRRFQPDGSAIGPTVKISHDNVLRFAETEFAMDHDGKTVAVWEGSNTEGLNKIMAQRFLSNVEMGGNFQVSTRADSSLHFGPGVVLNHGRIFTIWSDYVGVSETGPLWANILDFTDLTVSATTASQEIPESVYLFQNFPNPFNPATTIRYQVPRRSGVQLIIYNILGVRIITLIDAEMAPGDYEVQWQGQDSDANLVPSGIYIYKLSIAGQTFVRKMALIR